MTAGLVLDGITVRIGGRAVVSDLGLALAPGSFAAIVGPNGAGKTSLIRALVGLVRHEGRAVLDGTDLAGLAPRERARRLAYLPQGHEMHWPLPARDVVALGRLPHGAGDPTRLAPADAAAVDEAMRLTDTQAFAERAVTTLSGGERARVAAARAVAVGAPLLLADEPTAALDPRHALDAMRRLRDRARSGALVVAVTHDLGLAARFADRIAVMAEGRLAAFGPPDEALSPDILRRIFGIEAFRAEHGGETVLVPWR